MPTSMMLQLKISATKKRLFDGFISFQSLNILALCGLVSITAVMVRVISAGGNFTVVPLEIPVVSAPIEDRSLNGFREQTTKAVGKYTLTVALTPKEFIFGDLTAFTERANDMQNKFLISHVQGSPQVNALMDQIKKWQDDRLRRLSIRSDGVLLLVPDSRVPMNVVIRVVKLLRESNSFNSVVLAGGLI